MPYPNQHSARLQSPEKFSEFRTIKLDQYPDGILVVLGVTDEGESEFQALRADAKKMSMQTFKEFLREHNFSAEKVMEATSKSMAVELFSTWLPVDVMKGSDDQDSPRTKIGGIISTDSVDQQGDVIMQEGMDFSYFLDKGWFNYEHKQGADNILGAPTSVEPIKVDGKRATRVEGYLLNDRPKAREIIDTARAIQRANLPRTLGFSVEGQVIERDTENPRMITKCKILNVAITSAPVNPDARLEVIARSLMNKAPIKAEIAALILDAHPELADEEVMSELHDLMGKGKIGYQTPAEPDASASLSPLVAQDMSNTLSLEDAIFEKMRIEMSSMMDERMTALRAAMYGEKSAAMPGEKKAAMPNISARQLTEVMRRVFPHLSHGQARTLATNLVSSAKSSYNY